MLNNKMNDETIKKLTKIKDRELEKIKKEVNLKKKSYIAQLIEQIK